MVKCFWCSSSQLKCYLYRVEFPFLFWKKPRYFGDILEYHVYIYIYVFMFDKLIGADVEEIFFFAARVMGSHAETWLVRSSSKVYAPPDIGQESGQFITSWTSCAERKRCNNFWEKGRSRIQDRSFRGCKSISANVADFPKFPRESNSETGSSDWKFVCRAQANHASEPAAESSKEGKGTTST